MVSNYDEVFVDNGVKYGVIKNTVCTMKIEKGCSETITIPSKTKKGKKITTIGDGNNAVFYSTDCEIGRVEITLPDTVRTLSKNAFNGAKELKKLYMSNSVKKVGKMAFNASGVEEVRWSSSCESVPEFCFCGSNLQKFVAGSAVSQIGSAAFTASSVKEIDLSQSLVTDLPLDTFNNCYNLEKIIPSYYMSCCLGDSSVDGYEIMDDGSLKVREKRATPKGAIRIAGNEFVITGTLSRVRARVEESIIRMGGRVSGRVTSSTDYLVVGDKPGETKLRAAAAHLVPQITESDLIDAGLSI